MYHDRAIESCWGRASKQFPVLLLTGARQVGKTTVLRHITEQKRRYVTLDDPALRALANEDPALFLQRFPPPVLIDEIQYAPGLIQLIKMEVDESHKAGLFWLTGSQQFHMMKNVSETLAGRIAILNLLGFSSRERRRRLLDLPPFLPERRSLKTRQSSTIKLNLSQLYETIWKGGFPGLIAGPIKDRELFFSSYLQTYLQRDVKDLSQVGDEVAFVRFLKACAGRTAQMLNMSDLARDADVSVNTAKHWISILQASFQIELVYPYHSNITKRLVKRPKLYFLDTGLCSYLADWSSAATLETGAMSGAILETYVFSEILKSWWHNGEKPRLYYYRDKDGKEIDFLFEKDQTLYPLEVKKAASPQRKWARNFDALKRLDIRLGEGAVVCLCREALPIDRSISAIPVGVI
jgi:predicted AAA+ superfamily ATPase